MSDRPTIKTLQDLLNLVVDPKDPLRVGAGLANYRSALRTIAKLPGMPSDLALIPADAPQVLQALKHATNNSSSSLKIPKAAATRIKKLFEIAKLIAPRIELSDWQRLKEFFYGMADERDIDPRKFTPITHTLARLASQDNISPAQVSAEWITSKRAAAVAKEASSLRDAAALLDLYRELIPGNLKCALIGALPPISGQRKSGDLPSPLALNLEAYLLMKRAATMLQGVDGPVRTTEDGVSEATVTAIRQAIQWYHDCLVAVGYLLPNSDANVVSIARIDWLEAVIAESIADLIRIPTERRLPWRPIGASKVRSHFRFLRAFLFHYVPDIKSNFKSFENINATFNKIIEDEMTTANKDFCKALLRDDEKIWLVLNMHTILFQQAQTAWKQYSQQSPNQQAQTLNLTVLTAIAAIETSYPFRASTVLNLSLFGATPDIQLPTEIDGRIEFDIIRRLFKNRKSFDAFLEDSPSSRPRAILNWFISGPREEILRNAQFLAPNNRRASLLFAGYDYDRYNKTLSFHSERLGMRMTTHKWRHALASILINLEDNDVEEIAAIMNITVAVLVKKYAFVRKALRIARGMRKIDALRTELNKKISISFEAAQEIRNRK